MFKKTQEISDAKKEVFKRCIKQLEKGPSSESEACSDIETSHFY